MIHSDKKTAISSWLHLPAICVFLLVTVIFFSPQFFEDKQLPQSDITQFQGISQDLREYYNKDGESSAWAGNAFSGMPAYQIGVWGGSPNFLDYLEAPLRVFGGTTAGPVLAGMVMAYILFLILGFNIPIAMFGAIAYSLSSYNIIILDAGHVTKAWAIAYMPIVVGGLLCMFKKKHVIGGLCMALGLALQIKSNHLQITYYTAILCAILYISLVVKQIKDKDFSSLLKSSGILAIAVILALATNAGSLYSNYEMSKTSTRGASELTAKADEPKQGNGLEKDYVFGWSYGQAEILSLLVPNVQGGISRPFDEKSATLKSLQGMVQNQQIDAQNANTVYSSLSQYWGDQPFTSGPVYIGAIVCFLFLLGMLIIRNPLKWVLLGATIFFIFLSWGKNFEAFNDLFYYHFPLYNKFRAVSQALVIPALLMVIGAVWAIKEFFYGETAKDKQLKSLYISAGITGGLCLLLWVMPTAFFNFISGRDLAWKDQLPATFLNAVISDRKELLTADALRSLIFILLSAGIMWISIKKDKIKNISIYATLALVLLTTCDLWIVDKRFLGEEKFVNKAQQTLFKMSAADEIILKDKENYRVLNLNNPFQDGLTSYYHRSIGGYHAAKLQRYNQLIEQRLTPELMNIYQSFQTQSIDTITMSLQKNTALNMLNARYLIFDPSQPPIVNPFALGNAWFIEDYKLVDNADEEIEALNSVYPELQAVVDKRYAGELEGLKITPDSTASITLTDYKPNILTYQSKAESEQFAVFSEVFYANGWNAYIDGNLTPHFCANWTLRAMRVPAGEHEIVFKFEPTGYNTSRILGTASSIILILLLIGTIVGYFIRQSKAK